MDVSIFKNKRLGLTGFLHAEDGLFVQYIEGPGDSLWNLYERLKCDKRHKDLVLMGQGFLTRRRFSEWRMGYSSTNILSFPEFLDEISSDKCVERASGLSAVFFLMAACQRKDLGIRNYH